VDGDGEDPGLPVLEEDHHGTVDPALLVPDEGGGAGIPQDPLQELRAVSVFAKADRLEPFEVGEVPEVRVPEHGQTIDGGRISFSRKG
jgi:hypothetical protein